MKTRKWARGVVTTNYYNEFGELAGKAYSDGTTAITNRNFNFFGQPQQIGDAAGMHDLTYDYAGRLLSETIGAIVVSYGYDRTNGLAQRKIYNGSANVLYDFGFDTHGRLAFVTNGSAVISYGYLPQSDLIQYQTNKQSGNTVVAKRNWEYGTRVGAITHTIGGTPFQGQYYVHDGLGRRIRATSRDGSAWAYAYNDRSEVIGGKRYWEDFTPVAGQQFEYMYDSIGNRSASKAGGDENGANLRQTSYSPNSLNQYSVVTSPSHVQISGAATATATVTVNWNLVYERGEYYHREVPVSNGSGPLALLSAIANLSGTTATNSGSLLVPRASQSYTYDLDGNVTADGLWHYKWDAENRLVEMTNATGLALSARLKVTFEYDHSHKRVRKV